MPLVRMNEKKSKKCVHRLTLFWLSLRPFSWTVILHGSRSTASLCHRDNWQNKNSTARRRGHSCQDPDQIKEQDKCLERTVISVSPLALFVFLSSQNPFMKAHVRFDILLFSFHTFLFSLLPPSSTRWHVLLVQLSLYKVKRMDGSAPHATSRSRTNNQPFLLYVPRRLPSFYISSLLPTLPFIQSIRLPRIRPLLPIFLQRRTFQLHITSTLLLM
jgi:hypothetical protein